MKRMLSALCALSLLLSVPVHASFALGDDLWQKSTTLGEGVQWQENLFYSNSFGDLRRESYIIYTPNLHSTPIVTYGDTVTALTTTAQAAQELEEDGIRVLCGVNGGFYVVANGSPVGAIITEGALQSGSPGGWTLGFCEDGTVLLGDMGLSMPVTREDGTSFSLSAVNRVRGDGGFYLYTHTFNEKGTTGCVETGTDVLCSLDGALTLGSTVTLTVEEVLTDVTATAVPEGMVVLTVNRLGRESDHALLQSLTVGEELTLTLSVKDGWEKVRYGLGSYSKLLENGALAENLESGSAPRTAVGLREDGTLILYTMDGRRSGYSIGASQKQVAERLLELGCVSALSLDGGGSTTMLATLPDSRTAELVNRPSENALRAVNNQIFIVASAQSGDSADHLWLQAAEPYLLVGTDTTLRSAVVDDNGLPMSRSMTVTASDGSVEGGTFTAPLTSGTVTLTGRYRSQQTECTVEVIDQPTLRVQANGKALSQLTIAEGDCIDLDGKLFYRHIPLTAEDTDLQWTLEGAIGTLEENGLFTAADGAAEGKILVQAGQTLVELPVSVQSTAPLLQLEQTGTTLTGRVSSAAGTVPALDTLSLSWDGTELALQYDAELGTLTAELPSPDGYLHHVVLEVSDEAGRRSRAALDIAPDEAADSVFSDTEGHWAAAWMENLHARGILSGVSAGEELLAQPDRSITRQELATLLWRSMGTSLEAEDTELPFADCEDIAPWAQDAVAGLYALGILQGSSKDGVLLCNPNETVSRAQAVTMLGRMLGEGYPVSSHTFTDSDQIPAWAQSYVDLLCSLDFLRGNPDGSFAPSATMTRAQLAKLLYLL